MANSQFRVTPKAGRLLGLALALMAFDTSAFAAERAHKVIAAPRVLPPGAGVTLWHDYGTFALYRFTDGALARLSRDARAKVQVADDMDQILIDALPFDTQVGAPKFPPALAAVEGPGPALHLVQFVGPIKQEWLAAVAATGARLVHYVANNGYLVWADAGARQALAGMAAARSFLQYSGPFDPYFKLGPTIRPRVSEAADPDAVVPVTIQTYRHEDKAETEGLIEAAKLSEIAPWGPILAYQNVSITLRARDILPLAQRPDVNWIGERLPREKFDEIQGQLIASNFNGSQSGPSGPGYKAFVDSFGFSTNPADYPIVDITDDGISGGTAPTQPVNPPTGDPTMDPRVVFRNSCNNGFPNDGRSPDGHGSINASIAIGLDIRTGAPFQDVNGFNLGMGMNPYGRVGGTRIFGGAYNISLCGGTDAGVIAASYNAGARISSNSWGCSGCAGSYDDGSQAYDAGTRDALPATAGNQELITVFAAGNSGPGAGTVGTPGNGKNMITVGASENFRNDWTDGCAVGPTGADNAMDVIGFSSRGPSPGGRTKPEVIGPGTHIQGTASTHPAYNGSGVCDQYHPVGQTIFAASSGTSHSTPAVSGVASLVYRWLQTTYGMPTPSPAMMKAYLIAHPTYLTGVSANDTLPSNSQGYGMPDLEAAFDTTSKFLLNQSTLFDNTGETYNFVGAVANPSKQVRIVLVYTDAPGAIGTSPQVNNLNLQATVGGTNYQGNRFTGRYSTPGGGAPDNANNYEAIFLPAGTTGAIQVTITAANVAGDGVPNVGDASDQDFALVCYNCAQNPTFTLQVTPTTRDVCAPASGTYTVDIGSILGFSTPVNLSATGNPAGTTTGFVPNPVTPPGSSTFTIGNTGAAGPGSYTVNVAGAAGPENANQNVSFNLYTAAAGAVTLTAPANGATNVPQAPNFTWSAATQAGSCEIQIATDAGFATIVASATGLPGTSYNGANLNSNTVHYWRVRAVNACGNGAYSATFQFTTVALPGDCPIGTAPSVLFQDGFETGGAGWTHSGTGDSWALTATNPHTGASSYHANDPAVVTDQRLVSPAVALPTGQAPLTLKFWNYQSLEPRAGGCYDGGILEISTDGGTNWIQITSGLLTDPYDGTISNCCGNPLVNLNAWCGDPQPYLNSIVSLDSYAGQTVRFRFRLGSDSSVARTGWNIDDVVVQSCLTVPVELQTFSIE